ncbi:MAG: helix-turn-helix transcriptional regulator [Gammaproteobacteria bacterium]|nr:helix-turn-helix transcriptional regulator [Gammaproteobacteria bacterium]
MTKPSRTYNQNCAIANALDVVGERWTLLIVRELAIGPRRYGQLLENLRGIGTNLLAKRLKELENKSLIQRSDTPQPSYSLTDLGRGLEPVLHAIFRWGIQLESNRFSPEALSKPEWDAVAIRALYRADRDRGLTGRYRFYIDDYPYTVEKAGSEVRVSFGEEGPAKVVVRISKGDALAYLAYGDTAARDKLKAKVIIEGDLREADMFMTAFGMGD